VAPGASELKAAEFPWRTGLLPGASVSGAGFSDSPGDGPVPDGRVDPHAETLAFYGYVGDFDFAFAFTRNKEVRLTVVFLTSCPFPATPKGRTRVYWGNGWLQASV
jgi:hypothetical protein